MNPDHRAYRLAEDLRSFADFLDQYGEELPHVTAEIASHVWGYSGESVPESVALAMRAGLKGAGAVEKEYSDNYFRLYLTFGSLKYKVVCNRDEVCERKVLGTEMVTRSVPPEGEWTEKEIEQDIVEWVCNPLLSVVTDAG